MLSMIITPKFGDVDGLRHINNNVLPQWFELARNPIYRIFNPDYKFETWNLILAHIDFDFVEQMHFDQDVEIRSWVAKVGNSSFVVYQEAWQGGRLCVKGKTVVVDFDFANKKSVRIPDAERARLMEHYIELPE